MDRTDVPSDSRPAPADCRACEADYQRWLMDINRWQTEHQAAMFRLEQLEEVLRQHGSDVRAHAEAVELLMPGFDCAVGALPSPGDRARLLEQHRRLADCHARAFSGFQKLMRACCRPA